MAEFLQSDEISSLEISLIQNILKQTVEEIIILNRGESKNQDVRPPLKVRFKDKVRQQMFYHPTLQIMKDALLDLIDIKLKRDIDYLRKILTETYIELRDGSFDTLHKAVNEEKTEQEEENELLFDYVKNKSFLEYLEEKLKRDTDDGKRTIKELDEIILDLENKIHDCKIKNSMKARLVAKWENTRYEQEEVILENKEKELTENCENIQRKINLEKRAITDIEVFIEDKIKSINEQIEFWVDKYDTEVEQLDDDIQITKENIIEIKQKNEELKELYATRQTEIDDYWHEKTIQREARELEEKKWQSAVKLQSWWRGTMVRRGFGRFRKKKGKGKGKGKKK